MRWLTVESSRYICDDDQATQLSKHQRETVSLSSMLHIKYTKAMQTTRAQSAAREVAGAFLSHDWPTSYLQQALRACAQDAAKMALFAAFSKDGASMKWMKEFRHLLGKQISQSLKAENDWQRMVFLLQDACCASLTPPLLRAFSSVRISNGQEQIVRSRIANGRPTITAYANNGEMEGIDDGLQQWGGN